MNWEDLLVEPTPEPRVITPKLDLGRVGHSIQLVGGVWHDASEGSIKVILLPGETAPEQVDVLAYDREQWEALIKQSDTPEAAVLAKHPNGRLYKAILRKNTRQISQGVSWAVYRRDGFKCRYCAADDVPLTVDHLVLWEKGGPSTEANLVAACRKCNRTRGNTEYGDWLKTAYYKQVSKKLSRDVFRANRDLESTLGMIETVPVVPGRKRKR